LKKTHLIIIISALGLIAITIFGITRIIKFYRIDSFPDRGDNYDNNKSEDIYFIDSLILTDIYWHIEYDTILNREYLVKGNLLDSLSQSPAELIDILNRRESKCKIEYIDIIEDTIAIRITDDQYLSEQMGSTGAYYYLAETVYTLTEAVLIKFVRIEMEYGSHAGPGLYSRNDFRDLIIK